jgi:hypothetical protein
MKTKRLALTAEQLRIIEYALNVATNGRHWTHDEANRVMILTRLVKGARGLLES